MFIRAGLNVVVLAGMLALAGCANVGKTNSTDKVSNPKQLDYTNVNMVASDYSEPFKRSAPVRDVAFFKNLKPGTSANDVQVLLGAPLKQNVGQSGQEWDYDVSFKMPKSENYLVCQYKVVINASQKLQETVWRRQQCLDLVSAQQ